MVDGTGYITIFTKQWVINKPAAQAADADPSPIGKINPFSKIV